ncbi:MAG TPA: acyl-CoA dehydrogenase [Bacteroidetes bacterium]|nr:acyl-CoA dehydrogenase [Bacteroidota bacterium]
MSEAKLAEQYIPGGSFLYEHVTPEEMFTPEDFTDEHKMIAETTEDFVAKEVVTQADKIEEKIEELSVRLLRKAGELGLLAVDIPEEYGGLGLDKTSSIIVAEKIGRAGSWAVSFGAHTGIGTLPIVYFGTKEQKDKYLAKIGSAELVSSYSLSEPGSGSDALSARTTANLNDDGKYYLLNGTKMWLTNAGWADVYITFAKVDGDKFTAFIIDKGTPGVSLGAEENKLGIHGSSTRELLLDNAKIPVENVLGEIDKGHKVAFNILNIGRFKLGAEVLGAMKEITTQALKYAMEREQFNQPIVSFGLIKHKLGEMAIRSFISESMVYRTSGLIDSILESVTPGSPNYEQVTLKGIEEYATECSIIKVYASEALDYVVDEGLQIYGGYGYSEDYPMARAYRDSRINRIFEGTNEINRLLMPGMLIKRATKGQLPILQKAQALLDEVLGFSMPEEPEDEFLAEETKIVENAKKIALLMIGGGVQKFMAKIGDQQEILGHIADIMMEVYAMESVLVRVKKMAQNRSEEAVSVYVDVAQTCINDAINRVAFSAMQILPIIEEGDTLRTYVTMLRRFTKHTPLNTAARRRNIVAHMMEAEKYNL